MSDGSIKIDVKLDSNTAKKDLQEVGKVAQTAGNNVAKSFDNVEKTMKKASSSFDGSKIAKQLQNVEKAIDKTNSNIDKQKQKLEQLKQAYDKSTDTKEQNKIAKDMQKATAEVTKLETKLNTLKDKQVNVKVKIDSLNGLDGQFKSAEMSATKSVDSIKKKVEEAEKSFKNFSVSESISKTGQMISGAGDAFTRNVTAPITLFGVAAAKVGMDFDYSMSRVKAISGATGEDFKKLHDQALQLGKDTAFSAKQAAEGMENLAAAGFSTEETMQAMPGLLDLAAASGESLASSSDIAASTLRGFGLEASQAGHVADVLAKNANATNAAVADTGEAMKYIAPVAHSMGLSLEEVTASIGEMANSGIKGSQAGTTLRSALTRLASPSKEAAKLMESLGFKAFDSHGKLKPLSTILGELQKSTSKLTDQKKEDAIATIFGQEAMSGMMVLMQGGTQALDDLTNSYKNADGAADEMAKTMQDNAKSSIEQMTGSIETAAIKLEEAMAPSITNIANTVQDLANKFADLPESTQQTIIDMALFAATIGPVTKTIGGVTSGLAKLVSFGGSIGKALGLITTGAEAGSVALGGLTIAGGLAAGAGAALTIGIAGAVTHYELMQKSVSSCSDDLTAWEKVVNKATGSTIKSKSELQKAGLVYKDFGDNVSENFKDGIEKATKSYHDFEMALTGANSDAKISDENKVKLTSSINSMIDGAKSAINKRKTEVSSELSKMFTLNDGSIDNGEQAVLDELSKSSDAKLKKIDEIQKQIGDVWQKAIAEHGKLSEEDIQRIKDYLKQVQQIRAEVEAKNTTESDYAKNQYGERLKGISAEDATSEYKSASDELSKKFADARATYKTGMDEMQALVKKYNDEGNKEAADNAKKVLDAKDKEYKELIEKEKSKRREYLDMLYEKNPTLKGNLNEVDGTMFSKADRNSQGDLYKLKQQYSQIAEATESGMKRVQDSTGKWHDIYVTVDQATGNITSAYDTFTGKFGGYSTKFANEAEATGKQVQKSMQELTSNIKFGSSNLKLEGNAIVKIDTGDTVSKLDTIINKANGLKVAVANINGTQVKMEFDKNGAITNINDVVAAINGKIVNNPAVVNVDVNNQEALDKFTETENKADELGGKTPTVEATANTEQANSNIDTTSKKTDDLNGKSAEVTVNANTQDAESALDKVLRTWKSLLNSDNVVTKTIRTAIADSTGLGPLNSAADFVGSLVKHNYTGTGGGEEGLTTAHEHGWEISTGEEAIYLMGGGSGIMDHMSSVNEMNRSINSQVNNTTGKVVGTLASAIGSQNSKLSAIVDNTAQTVKVNQQGNKLNEQLAKDIVSQAKNSTTGSFSTLENEIVNANTNKTKADKLKVEDYSYYSSSKQNLDSLDSQLDDLKKQIQEVSDQAQSANDDVIGVTDKNIRKVSEVEKKEIEAQKHILEVQQHKLEQEKDNAEKEANMAKMAAEKEIEIAKDNAEQQVKIAEEKKVKLEKLAEATTTAIKNKYETEKKAAENSLNNDLKQMEDSYNSSVKSLENKYKRKSDEIDKKIKDLEEKSAETSRDDERNQANNNIYALETKIANTADEADKRKYQLELEKAKKELSQKESSWNIEDQKAELEAEKDTLSKKEEAEKESLEKSYNSKKEAKEKELKETDKYYDKLLEEDSINAQARFLLLQGSNEELVQLLQSYNPLWQDAGQSLADSLLTGLNSQKQSIQDSVREMIGLRSNPNASTATANPHANQYYDTATNSWKGYASGTSSNPFEGYYLTNELGPESSSRGDVAYVSKGAAIKNAMQTEQMIKAEIARQVSQLQATQRQYQMDAYKMMAGSIAQTKNNTQIINNDKGINLYIDKVVNSNERDTEQFVNEISVLQKRQEVN